MSSMNYTLQQKNARSKNNGLNWPQFAMRVNRAAMRQGWLRTFGPIVGVKIVNECFDKATDKLRDVVYWEYCQPKE